MWRRRSAEEKAKDIAHLATYYWSRLIATAGCWFFWDFGFYGNKVFQSQFVSILQGGSASPEACDRSSGLCAAQPSSTVQKWCPKPGWESAGACLLT